MSDIKQGGYYERLKPNVMKPCFRDTDNGLRHASAVVVYKLTESVVSDEKLFGVVTKYFLCDACQIECRSSEWIRGNEINYFRLIEKNGGYYEYSEFIQDIKRIEACETMA